MASRRDDKGQLYTIEGIIASLILLSVLLFIIQANSVVIPQTEKIADMKLQQKASDILTCLDISNGSVVIANGSTGGNDLKTYVEKWNDHEAIASNYIAPEELSDLASLHQYINSNLPADARYNLFISYDDINNAQGVTTKTLIMEGQPLDNSVVATRLVTLNQGDTRLSTYWKADMNPFPKVVEVKIVCWYL